MAQRSDGRARIIVAVVAICALALAGQWFWGRTHEGAVAAEHELVDAGVGPGRILFRDTQLGASYGNLAVADLTDLARRRIVPNLACEVLAFAAGHGVCLAAERGFFTSYEARLFDADYGVRARVPLAGIPSRTRVAPNGAIAAVTVFVTGHSYDSIDFSVQTLLLDTTTGAVLADLERDLAIERSGLPFRAEDFNFWGVTFTPDSKRFYCTLSTGQHRYLIEADVASRKGVIVHDAVECPSLSPDATRIAFKRRLVDESHVRWQLRVLELATKRETPLAEKRSVDDQLEWLDDGHVLYAVPAAETGSSASTDVWVASADGSSPPRLLLPSAYSPAVAR
jgi:dipeptidyl aminopeptidase/acylaminoacyl peptidase